MDGKRRLMLGVVAMASLLAACSATPAAAPASSTPGSSAAVQAGPSAAAPTGVNTKEGGVALTPLTATLGTVNGEGVDEQDVVDTLRQTSAGVINVTVSPNWRHADLTSETELIQDVAAGKAQLGYVALRAFDTVGVTSFEGIQAPFVIDSFDLEAQVLGSDWAQKLLDGPRSAGVVGLGYIQGPLRQPLGVTRALTSVSSFQGAKFGIRPSKVSEMTLKALGATPTNWSDLAGLDGIEMDVPSIEGNKYDRQATSLTGNIVLWPRPSMFFANAVWFDGLTAAQQEALRSAVTTVGQKSLGRVKGDAAISTDTLCRRSVKVTNASSQAIDELRAKVQPVIDKLETDPGTKATIDAIAGLRGSMATQAFGPCGQAAASGAPQGGPTALDGTWTTSFTKAELAAAPLMDKGEVNDGNWGDFTMTFASGRVSYSGTNSTGTSGASSGTFTVKDDIVAMAFDQGDNIGETFTFRWSVYKNTLTFRRDETLGIGPTLWLVKAWTKS